MKSVPKGLLAALAGLAVVVALPYILAWEPPGKAGGSAVEGMETVALISALPEGYRVDTGGEVRFVSPEEVLAGLATPEWDGLRGEEGAEEALGVWCVLTHSRLLGEMADFTAEAGEEGLLEQAWLTLPGWEEADDPDLLEAVSGYSRYFLSADGTLIRAEASMAEILAALQAGETPAGLYARYGGEGAVLEMAAEK